MSATPSSEKLWTRPFFMLLAVNLFSGMCSQMTFPLVKTYADAIGASGQAAASIAGLMSLAGLICCPFAGMIYDRVNRKYLVIVSMLINSISVALHAVCTSVPMLVAMRLITGVSFAFTSTGSVVFPAMFVPRFRYGEGLGYIALTTILAQAAGPALGVSLMERVGYQTTFLLAGICGLAAMAVVCFIPYREENTRTARKFRLKDLFEPRLTLYMVMAALLSGGNGLVSAFLVSIGNERGIANIALLFTAYSICMVFIRPFAGKLLDKKGIFVILFPAFLLAAVGLWLVGVGMVLAAMLAAGVLKALGQGAGVPSIQAHCVLLLGKERAGVATSTCQIGQHIGNAFAPILGGFAVEASGYRNTFCGYAVIMLIGGLALLLVQRFLEKRQSAAGQFPQM